jgi:hypothetical protein
MKYKKKLRKPRVRELLSNRDFWIEYITLYFTILIITLLVQLLIFRIELIVILICLSKSLFTTIPNIIVIMYGRRVTVVKKNKILEALVYAFSSLPYLDMLILLIYKENFNFSFKILVSYISIYFIVGFFIDRYIKFATKVLQKIFNYSGHL